jgi:hypothetical protein
LFFEKLILAGVVEATAEKQKHSTQLGMFCVALSGEFLGGEVLGFVG